MFDVIHIGESCTVNLPATETPPCEDSTHGAVYSVPSGMLWKL